jgi:hypothetical protein
MVDFLTRTGSSYSIDDSGLLLKNGSYYSIDDSGLLSLRTDKSMREKDNPIYYMGLANSFELSMRSGIIISKHFDYESPEGIEKYIKSCPSERAIIRNLDEGVIQSYMVNLVGISKNTIERSKNELQFEANSMSEFVYTLIEKLEQKCPADKVVIVPHNLLTSILTSVR